MITNPAVEPPSLSPISEKNEQPYSHSDPFVTTPNVFEMHQQQTDPQPPQTQEMDPPSPKTEGQALPITSTDESPHEAGNYQGGGYYGDSYNSYPQQGYPGNGYPQQGTQAWIQHQQHHQGNNMEYYHQHHQGSGGYSHNYYNHPQHSSNYPTSDPYYQQQQMHHSQYYQHPHGHHHLHPHQANNGGSGGGGGGSNNCTPSPHAGSDDSSGDAVNESKPAPHHLQQQYPHGKPGYPGGPFEMYNHPSHPNINETNGPAVPGGMLPHNTNTGYVKIEMGTQPISTSVLKRPRSSLLPAPKRSKKSSRHRDPNEPQKPVSAYALFFRDTQAQIKSRSPAATFGEVSKMVAALWDSLDPDSKANYKRRTETAKKEYLKRLAAYRASLVSKGGDLLGTISPYNIGGGSSGFAYPTPSRSAVVSHLPGNVTNPSIIEQDGLDQPLKMCVPLNQENVLRNDRGLASPKENSAVGDHASVPLNGGPGRQYSPVNHQPFPSPNSHTSPTQHPSMKPMGPGLHQSQSNTYGAHHHIGPQISTGSTMSTPQSSQPLPMGGSSFHASDLHQTTTQSNQLGSGHLPRGNYQQQGRVS